MSYSSNVDGSNLIDELLKEQQSLSAVERFSQFHDQEHGHLQEPYYRNLLPATPLESGEQYSFEVDLDACTGCKACVTACHSLNGLDEDESWRDVGVLFGGTTIQPRQQTVTTACHHCADPGCLNGCPVLAYEKDEETGIVTHLDDQCIGCQYCILKCPYDVPKYNKRLGIVRKCDMCIGRLKEGEAPACVQACPTQAIAIRKVKVSELGQKGERMLPGAFDSEYTKPTTNFRTKKPLPGHFNAADDDDLTPEHEHTPLVLMLALTQVSIGMMAAAWLFRENSYSLWMTIIGLVIGGAGMASSIFHLGSPKGAWRAFLGLRKSWLSREIVVLGAWFPLAIGHTVLLSALYFLPDFSLMAYVPEWLPAVTGLSSIVFGLLGIFCSVMVYVDTHREFWSLPRSASRFFGSALVSGAVTASILGVAGAPFAAGVFLLMKLGSEALSLRHAKQTQNIYARKTARLQLYPLRNTLIMRAAFALTAVVLSLALLEQPSNIIISLLLIGFFTLGELFERRIYFGAVAALRMPGLIPSRAPEGSTSTTPH
ncbi:MAG: DmsC/YnfH family molybdoenzyme membrane anchor subunit [Akkermansiaceae bacterium]